MSQALDFAQAIDQALKRGSDYQDAQRDVAALTKELDRAVNGKMPGVSVGLYEAGGFEAAGRAMRRLNSWGALGGDQEDQVARTRVVAENSEGEKRTLWEIELEGSAGYPVELRGPEDGRSTFCATKEDLVSAFFEAASSGLVGRKLNSLVPSKQAPADESESESG